MPRRQTLKSLPKAKSGARTNGSHKTAKTNGATRRHRTTTRKQGQMTGGGPFNKFKAFLKKRLGKKNPEESEQKKDFVNPLFDKSNAPPTREHTLEEQVNAEVRRNPLSVLPPNVYSNPKGPSLQPIYSEPLLSNVMKKNLFGEIEQKLEQINKQLVNDRLTIIITKHNDNVKCCTIIEKKDDELNILMSYVLNSCSSTIKTNIKDRLNSPRHFFVYRSSSQGNPLILCTKNLCYMENETQSSYTFKFTESEDIKYATIPYYIEVNNIKKQIYDHIYLTSPQFIPTNECSNQLIYDANDPYMEIAPNTEGEYMEVGQAKNTRESRRKIRASNRNPLKQNHPNPFRNAENTGYVEFSPNPSSQT